MSIEKWVRGSLAALSLAGAAGKAEAQKPPSPDRIEHARKDTDDAFQELDARDAKQHMREAQQLTARKQQIVDRLLALSNPSPAKKEQARVALRSKIDAVLSGLPGLSFPQQMEALDAVEEAGVKRFGGGTAGEKKGAATVERPSPPRGHHGIFDGMEQKGGSGVVIKKFFDLKVPFDQAIAALKGILLPGVTLKYNGAAFTLRGDRVFFGEGRGLELKDMEARLKAVKIYEDEAKAVAEEFHL